MAFGTVILLAVLSFSIGLLVLSFDNRRRRQPLFALVSPAIERWSLPHLFLASFLTLFTELAFIRWIAVEIRVFAYFKNLALLLCFLGFGLGCALARGPLRWSTSVKASMALLIAVRLPIPGWREHLEGLSQRLGAAGDIEFWSGHGWQWTGFVGAAMTAGLLLFLLASILIPLGQMVSRQIDLAPRTLFGYSWNLFGSLVGILGFFFVCWHMFPPTLWLAGVLGGMALLQRRLMHGMFVASLILPSVALLRETRTPDQFSVWTPYQQIEVKRFYFPNGELFGQEVHVNHVGYQTIVNLSPEFLARHPGLLEEAVDDNPYNIAYRFVPPGPRVLILGAGTGNDAAAALRNGSPAVDAVEIDPAILQLGRLAHPERPYESPRVHSHLTDARAFLKRASRQYDLIMFGLLDSHTQFSDYSNMRIDNFVYTEESLREARRHLSPNGVLFVKFHVIRPWLGKRLVELLTSTFGKPPLVFFADSNYTVNATCFAISPSGQVEAALAADTRLAQFINHPPEFLRAPEVPVTTDDWPYLYHEGKWIPRTYFSLGVLVILLGLLLYTQVPEARRQRPSVFFFCMGAGFLLLETQVVSRLALYFGTTWQVNGIVISALLTALLLANAVADRWPAILGQRWVLAGLLGGLAVAYLLPLNRIPGPPAVAGCLAAVVFSLPVFFAGLLFSREFRNAKSPAAALGSNMLGAVAGGLLENLSLVIGMRALLLVAFGLYTLAAWGLRREVARTV
jgi:SAM-dependent methyltransferase